MRGVAMLLVTLLLSAGQGLAANTPRPGVKYCGVYAKYVCGGTPKPHHKVCGVYLKYSC